MIKYSFVIPVYNCGQLLCSCVQSISCIYEKTNPFLFEIVLIDDGSNEETSRICDELKEKYQKYFFINVYHQNNSGVSEARNKGICLAQGEYIIFIDSDDTVDADALRNLMTIVNNNHEIDMAIFGISFDYYLKNKCFRRDVIVPPLCGLYAKDVWAKDLGNLFDANVLSPLWNKIIRKKIIVNNNILLNRNMNILEDLECSVRIMGYCNIVFFSTDVVYHYNHLGFDDNSGNRLKKNPHLYNILFQLENSFISFIDNAYCDGAMIRKMTKEVDRILIKIYGHLASEKIKAVSYGNIKDICYDFKTWIDQKGMYSQLRKSSYLWHIYNDRRIYLYWNSRKSKIRHIIANYVKLYLGDFRKWKNMK